MANVEISTSGAPRAIGPYSQAVRAGQLLFVSGQIPVDPATGTVVPGGIKPQAHQVLLNLRSIIEAAGFTLKEVVKTTVYLKEIADFTDMNGVYAEYFSAPYPARATVEVSELPKSVLVEIDAVAVKED